MTSSGPGDPWEGARRRVRGEVHSALAPGARRCRHCGTESVTAARLCPRCGRELQEPPRGTRRGGIALGAAGLLVLIAAGGVILALGAERAGDSLDRAQRERAAGERALELAGRPQLGSGDRPRAGLPDEVVRASRRALVGTLADHVHRFAEERAREGALEGPFLHVVCTPYPKSAATPDGRTDLTVETAGFQCLAVRSDTGRVETGQPFLARVDFRRHRYAFCQVHPPPGEHGRAAALPEVPEECRPG